MSRPDWHLRPPFAIALAVIAIGASLIVWWAGLLVIGWVAAMYLWYRIGGW